MSDSNKYTEKQLKFVETFLSQSAIHGDYRKAGKEALLAAGYSSSITVNQVMPGVKELLLEQVSMELAQKIPRLLFRLEEVVDNPNIPGAKRLIDVCSTLLDRAGCVKAEPATIKVEAPDGIIIIPQKNTTQQTAQQCDKKE